ncbi:MAG: GNAT family N-acetyltransferase [Flavobacteriaceae bacterium]|nr:GNAT family N-acetyltransferase [Flavobacteriaceae bacterium]
MYSIERYTASNETLWNGFVSKAKNATFLFYRNFMDYHANRFHDHSLMIRKGDNLMALFPANQDENMIWSHGGLTYGGLILLPEIRLSDVIYGFQGVLQYYQALGIHELRVKTIPQIYHRQPSDEIDYLMFKLEANRYRCDCLSVVSPTRLKYSRDRKQGIKRGNKNGLKVIEVSDFEEFWSQILIPNLESKHQSRPVHTLDEIRLLKTRFPEQIRQFNVYDSGGIIVAGTTIFDTERVARSQYISGNTEKNNLGSLDLLHDYLLREVFPSKPYFDFGKSNEDEGRTINEGLLYWKEGFGARSVAHDYFSVDPAMHVKLNGVFK